MSLLAVFCYSRVIKKSHSEVVNKLNCFTPFGNTNKRNLFKVNAICIISYFRTLSERERMGAYIIRKICIWADAFSRVVSRGGGAVMTYFPFVEFVVLL